VAAVGLEAEHRLGDGRWVNFSAARGGVVLADVVVLAEHAAEVAVTEEKSARAPPAREAGLFTVVRPPGDKTGAARHAALAAFARVALGEALARTETTRSHQRLQGLGPAVELAALEEIEVTG
jgi:hypothetical protein